MAQYIKYTCRGGDTWDSIAIGAYDEERLASLLIDKNRKYIDRLVFEGGEVIKVPIIDEVDLEDSDSLPPWRS